MTNPRRSRSEQETIIRRAADEAEWDVYSEDPKVIRRLEARFGSGIPHGEGFRWLLPASAVSFRKTTIRSEAQKAAAAERLRENIRQRKEPTQ